MNTNRILKECRARGDTCPTRSSKISSHRKATSKSINNSRWRVITAAGMMALLDYLCWLIELNSKPWKIIRPLAKVGIKKVQGRLKSVDCHNPQANLFYKHWMAIIRPLTSNNRIYQKSRSMAIKNNLTIKDLMRKLGTQPSSKRKRLQSQKMLMHLEVVNNTMIRSHVVIVSTISQCRQEEISRQLA
jgi:hypothetical protein